MSLVNGWFPPTIVALAIVSLVVCIDPRRPGWWRPVAWASGCTVVLVVVAAFLVDGIALIPYQFPNSYYFWMALVVLAVLLGVFGWRGSGWGRRALPPVAFLLTTVMAATLVNANYQYFPTFRSLFGSPVVNRTTLAQVEQGRLDPHGHATEGATVPVKIPATVSHFVARTAYVWTPPAFIDNPTISLPVLILLAGTPGTTVDWLRAAAADTTADAYASAHGGLAPLIVFADSNGSTTADTECVDSTVGQAETYLTVDVPAFMRSAFGAKTGAGSLGIAGLSEGGMCALMLTLRHPDLFAVFGDFSGLSGPTVGETIDRPATVARLFGGSEAAYDQHDPITLLKTHRFDGTAGYFTVGTSDTLPLAAQQQLVPLARAAGISTCAVTPPGAHDFLFWTLALREALPFLAGHLALPVGSRSSPAC